MWYSDIHIQMPTWSLALTYMGHMGVPGLKQIVPHYEYRVQSHIGPIFCLRWEYNGHV